jgi:hypothetical protein
MGRSRGGGPPPIARSYLRGAAPESAAPGEGAEVSGNAVMTGASFGRRDADSSDQFSTASAGGPGIIDRWNGRRPTRP